MTTIKLPYVLILFALIVIIGVTAWSPDFSSDSARIDFQRSRMYVVFGAYVVLLAAVWWLARMRKETNVEKKLSWLKVIVGAFGVAGGLALISMVAALVLRGSDGLETVFDSMPVIVFAGFLAGIPICHRWMK